ncbi:MAG: AAA family ATPase [Planctomycetota bacterium]|nr:AAA family ATPase [Planctomycetota bacterium]
MSWTLAITGKGGVGKSTLAALAVRWLVERQRGPVLAVDADPNTSLDALLGVKAGCTVGGVREEAKRLAQNDSAGGMGKQELLDLKTQEALIEADGFDLIAMGRPEGPGCYCYANNALRAVLGRLAAHYASVVIDNEAGLENLSRRTVQKTDWLVFVAEPSLRGLTTARKLYDLALEMKIEAAAFGVVVNRVRGGTGASPVVARARELFAGTPVQCLGGLPEDAELLAHSETAEPIMSLSSSNPVWHEAGEMLRRMTGKEAPVPVFPNP